MQNNLTYKRLFFKNIYLLIIAAWLVTFSFIADNYWSGNSSIQAVKKNIEQYVHEQEKDFEKLLQSPDILKKINDNKFEEKLLLQLTDKKYFIYRYFINDIGQNQLVFWNTQTVLPSEKLLSLPGNAGFIKLENGYYVWRKVTTEKSITVALIPIKWNYFVTNQYLQNNFAGGLTVERQYDISEIQTNTAVKSIAGNDLFYITENAGRSASKNNPVAIIFRLFAALFVLVFIQVIATNIATYKSLSKALLFLIPVVLILRVISYYYPVPLNFRQFDLFDPAIYGSNIVLRSLGDLLINAVLFTWIILFTQNQLKEIEPGVINKKAWFKWFALIVVSVLLVLMTFTAANIIRSMVADSQISFDVINFFTLNLYSVIGFIVLCCIAIGYFLSGQILLKAIQPYFPKNFTWLYLFVSITGLMYLSFQQAISNMDFEIFILGWLIVYLLLMLRGNLFLSLKKINSSKLIFWLFFFSVTITGIIVLENSKKELRNREHYAETLATKTDPVNETLLNTLLTEFRNEYLAGIFYRFKNYTDNQFLKDSLVNGNFSVYTNKYETTVYTFDAHEEPLFNKDATSFNELNTVLKTQSRPTNLPNLYYYDESFDRFSYISRKTITNFDGDTLGYVFVLANPKKFKSDAVNLELFSKGLNNAIENSPVYAFAVYDNLQLINSHNDYAFATRLTKQQAPKNEFTTVHKNGFDELWYKAGPQKIVVIAKENNFLIESITLFSYLFCAFLLVTGLFWLLNIIIKARFKKEKIRHYWQLSIRNQIHGTVILISVLSFLIIGIATILFFISRYQNSNREKLSRVIHVMENEVRISLNDLTVFDDTTKNYGDTYRENLEKVIDKVSEIHAVDVNLYDLDGNLQVSSLPLPYNKGIISTKMDPIAYFHLNRKKEVQYFKEEKIGELNFVSNYVPVIDANGREYAYLNIPYFTSQSKLQEEIANFLVTIINLNAFIFLIAGIIALFITNRITRSFSFISEKMKAVNLGRVNEAIDWKRGDEIGELVKEYNKMVAKLDASAVALAKSEREGAWREMARQVAHEIKNPLTPMKLSLQYLQKSIAHKADNVEELTANVVATLVEQIEHLNHIAGEFSQFANIANSKSEVFNLHDVINQVVQLHAVNDRIHITWAPIVSKLFVKADRTNLNRVFTNLVLNAIQAVPVEKQVLIQISEEMYENKVLIKIQDNGNGIEEELQSKIFMPNFTTKSSGTGLGLAMCKSIVEQSKGNIWFETKEGAGSIFFVELPYEHFEKF
ncbi:MAG: HAMP domain-containing histidine kinase [Ferruginibacter sp.]|nr:HAMP domain-containing histidine kinase [Bacteroidota bacterium]MBX2919535.1 HAMP domain-containing histidine kinase [Ferruginibacter sp.]MCB0708389.1 HAMP domain-containing histidine kinase [Chitinophagaceae bacterium]